VYIVLGVVRSAKYKTSNFTAMLVLEVEPSAELTAMINVTSLMGFPPVTDFS
jgi:hypothetical protein